MTYNGRGNMNLERSGQRGGCLGDVFEILSEIYKIRSALKIGERYLGKTYNLIQSAHHSYAPQSL